VDCGIWGCLLLLLGHGFVAVTVAAIDCCCCSCGCGCRVLIDSLLAVAVADWWLLWSLIGGCRSHGLWLLQSLDCGCCGYWIVAVAVVGLWLLQLLDCGCQGHWIVAVMQSLIGGCHAVTD